METGAWTVIFIVTSTQRGAVWVENVTVWPEADEKPKNSKHETSRKDKYNVRLIGCRDGRPRGVYGEENQKNLQDESFHD